ncbi:SgcJ/EcaC family oxidoreductase [Streptomyces sp. G5(2025)]|uniref:SgcJ/EcaC family oxidoreductase n=1 Tax=Streptomyces sp. G5(2025) TaxID=3406628 RepID=UPI003C1A0A33
MTAKQTRTADETAIRKVLKGVYEAWNANDADAFVADYTDDASAILPGSYRKSREEIRESMQAGFSTFLKGSTTTDEVLDIRFLNDDAAVVISETGILFPGETEVPQDRVVIASWVLTRQDGKWLLAAYQNSPAVMNQG